MILPFSATKLIITWNKFLTFVIWDEIYLIRYETPKFRQYFPDYKPTDEGDIWLKRTQLWLTIDEMPSRIIEKVPFVTY